MSPTTKLYVVVRNDANGSRSYWNATCGTWSTLQHATRYRSIVPARAILNDHRKLQKRFDINSNYQFPSATYYIDVED